MEEDAGRCVFPGLGGLPVLGADCGAAAAWCLCDAREPRCECCAWTPHA